MFLKHTVIILILIKITLSYKQYKFQELCSGNNFKNIFDKITNNKPAVKLNRGDLSAAFVNHKWNSTSYEKFSSCEFDVKLDDSYSSNSGIFVSIKKLKLREHSEYGYSYTGPCIDFIRFTYKNGTTTRQICGNIETTATNNLIRNFFDEISGELRVEISIGKSHPFTLEEANSELEVDLVFTAYSTCYNGSNGILCSSDKCISDVLRNDQILNCPPPDCYDENFCINNEKPFIFVKTNSQESTSPSTYIIVPLVVLVVGALLWTLFCCKKKKPVSNSNVTNNAEELRPTARSDLDSYLEFQDVRPVPIASHHRPVPSAPPIGFKDDPPAYDVLFSTNPNNRVNV